MIRTVSVEREKTETETVDVTFCDRCVSADTEEWHLLYFNPRLEPTEEAKWEMEKIASVPRLSMDPIDQKYIVQEARRWLTLEHDGYLRICDDCYEEMFGWLDDRRHPDNGDYQDE